MFPTLHRHAAALFTALLLTAGLAEAGPTLSPPEAHDQAKAGTLTLIDIRTPAEWRETGVPDGAIRITLPGPQGADSFAAAALAHSHGDHEAPIALICRSGNRSTFLQQQLEARGFTHVYNVQEGVAGGAAGPGWIKRGLPIVTCKDC